MSYKHLYERRKINYPFTEENIQYIETQEKIKLDELFFLMLLLNDDCSQNTLQKVRLFLSIIDYKDKKKLFKRILCSDKTQIFFSFLRLHLLTTEECSIFLSLSMSIIIKKDIPLFDKALILSKLSTFQIIYDELDMTDLLKTLMKDVMAHINSNKEDFDYLIAFEISSRVTRCSTQIIEAYDILENNSLNFYLKEKISVENFTKFLILLDFDSNYQLLQLLKENYNKYTQGERKEIYFFINNNIELINIDFVIAYTNMLEENYSILFHNILVNEGISRINRLSFFSEKILRNKTLTVSMKEEFTTFALTIIKEQLNNPRSEKNLIVFCSNKLKEIIEIFPENDTAVNIYKELYKDSPYWSEFYKKRIEYQRERKEKIGKQVHSSLARKIKVPFKNKDYQKVVDILGEFNNLPKSLQLKYNYSLKKLDS